MKKLLINQLKGINYVLGYWIIFVIIPFLVAVTISNTKPYNSNAPVLLWVYIIFIAPFLYFIPYKLVKPKLKLSFVFLGLILPYLFIYLLIYLDLSKPIVFGF